MTEYVCISDRNGIPLDARFCLEFVNGKSIILFQSAGGTKRAGNARNKQYNEGLDLLLARLKELGAQLTGAYVASERVRSLSANERLLRIPKLPYPVDLESVGNITEFRRALCRPQRDVGTARVAGAAGGNNQKMMRVAFSIPPGAAIDFKSLQSFLVTGSPISSNRFALSFVASRDDVIRSLVTFNATAGQNVERASRLFSISTFCEGCHPSCAETPLVDRLSLPMRRERFACEIEEPQSSLN